MKPVARFRLTVRGLRVRVTVLADEAAVDRAYNGGRASRGRKRCAAFVEHAAGRDGARRMTLPLAGWTPGLVAHECVHVAVLNGRAAGAAEDDEPLAYAVGALTDAICRRLRRLEAA